MNYPAIFVRPMTAADIDGVLEIEQGLPEAPHWPRPAYLAAIDPEAALRRVALVAEESGVILGFAVASLSPPEAELESIAAAAGHQRRGLASRLFWALVAELRVDGAAEILLEVRASNRAAIELYRRLGFAEAGRRPRYYADPIEDAVLMRLGL